MKKKPSFSSIIALLAVIWSPAASYAQTAVPAGWDASQQGETTVLTRSFGEETLTLHVSPWFAADGEHAGDWLEARKALPSGRNPVVDPDPKVVESKLPGSYYTLRALRKRRGRDQLSFLTVCTSADGKLRSIDAFGARQTVADKAVLEEHVQIALSYCTDSESGQPLDVAKTDPAAPAASNQTLSGDPLPAATPPSGLVRLHGVIVMRLQPGGLLGPVGTVVALMDDGSFTDDVATLFEDGAARSRQDNPKDWGEWRQSGDAVLLKWHGDDGFEETHGDWIARSGDGDHKLEGCFGRLISYDGAGVGDAMVGKASSWCFAPDGRFSHESAGFAIATGGGVRGAAGATAPHLRGRYRIDGYAIRFAYDDGSGAQAGFAFLNDEHTHIAINGKRFMGSEE